MTRSPAAAATELHRLKIPSSPLESRVLAEDPLEQQRYRDVEQDGGQASLAALHTSSRSDAQRKLAPWQKSVVVLVAVALVLVVLSFFPRHDKLFGAEGSR